MKASVSKVMVMALAGMVFSAGISAAAIQPASISRTPLKIGEPSKKLSVGATYEFVKLAIDFDHAPDAVLEGDALSLYLGYDILPWLTLFTTLGGFEADTAPGSELNTDPAFKFSLGASAFLWQGDVLTPQYMSGRFTFKANVEVSRYDSDVGDGSVDWFDITASLPVGYEIFDEYPEGARGVDTSISFYVAPAISYISGSWDVGPLDDDFEAQELFGVIGGVDIFLSPGVSFGAEASYFDETSIIASFRFHL